MQGTQAMINPSKDAELQLLQATDPEAREVLLRIQNQRERLDGRRLAREQALALRRDATGGQHHPMAYGTLAERLISFGREHPLVCAGLVGAGLLLGPRKLIRMATIAMPIVMKLRRNH
ncbi:hypothetical protein DCO45_21325 [Comamonas sp. JNW]|jgi:hypothetical protein|nr:hypothetical protein DCO45_21325 [Comamonas sp. JNW]